jgi:hypothetical protein
MLDSMHIHNGPELTHRIEITTLFHEGAHRQTVVLEGSREVCRLIVLSVSTPNNPATALDRIEAHHTRDLEAVVELTAASCQHQEKDANDSAHENPPANAGALTGGAPTPASASNRATARAVQFNA